MSSLNDYDENDAQFVHVRTPVNSRFKAIRDSLPDRPALPAFRLPELSLNSMLRTNKPFSVVSLTPVIADIIPAPLRKTASGLAAPSTASQTTTAVVTCPGPASNIPTPKQPAAAAQGVDALEAVLATLTGDFVILGGYRGSVLRSATPPHRQQWVPVKVGLGIRQVDLAIGLTDADEERASETIIPDGMLSHVGPVDISRKLFRRLRDCENYRKGLLRVHDYGYDWRLSPHRLSQGLVRFLERLPCNSSELKDTSERGALVIAHSLGGLLVRHAANVAPTLFRGIVYAGTPQRCVNILGPLRDGDAVLFNDRVLTARVNFSIRTSFLMLPEDGRCFVAVHGEGRREELRVDFFDVEDWVRYRFSPLACPPLPSATTAAVPRSLGLPVGGLGRGDIRDPSDDSMATVTSVDGRDAEQWVLVQRQRAQRNRRHSSLSGRLRDMAIGMPDALTSLAPSSRDKLQVSVVAAAPDLRIRGYRRRWHRRRIPSQQQTGPPQLRPPTSMQRTRRLRNGLDSPRLSAAIPMAIPRTTSITTVAYKWNQ